MDFPIFSERDFEKTASCGDGGNSWPWKSSIWYECGKFVSWPLPLTYINSHRQKQIYNPILFSSLIIRTVPLTTLIVPLANRTDYRDTIVPNNNHRNQFTGILPSTFELGTFILYTFNILPKSSFSSKLPTWSIPMDFIT